MNSRMTLGMILAILAALVALFSSAYVVSQTEQALVLQFGKPVKVEKTPGLKFKKPFVENVEFYDQRLLDFNAEPKEVIAADQKRLIVDAFVRYRITDPLRFKQTVADERTMHSRLNAILESSLRQVLGGVPLSALISDQRVQIMRNIRDLVNAQTSGREAVEGGVAVDAALIPPQGFGIEVVDVRIMRADLPQSNSEGIYRRMQTEREREAKEFRAKGAEDAQKIRSMAERDRTILIAEAQKKAEILRGQGDGEATRIFAAAVGQDEEFYKFYRSLQAYRKVLNNQDTTMILSPKSEFLRYLDQGAH